MAVRYGPPSGNIGFRRKRSGEPVSVRSCRGKHHLLLIDTGCDVVIVVKSPDIRAPDNPEVHGIVARPPG